MKLDLLFRSTARRFENLFDRLRSLASANGSATGTVAGHLSDNTSRGRSLTHQQQTPTISRMELVKQINANHEVLLERMKSLESLVQQQTPSLSAGGDQGTTTASVTPPTETEIQAEQLRLTSENIELRKQVDSLVRQLTALEVAINGPENVAALDLLPQRRVCSKPAQPAATPVAAPVEAPKREAAPTVDTNKENQTPKQQEKKQKQPKQPKAEGEAKPKAAKPAPEPEREIDASRLDLRVGRIIDVQKHPDADSLYVEQIECGEEKPRTVVSGLVKFVPLDQMKDRLVVILCNLKPAKMRGVLSEAMVMCASTPEKVEILSPPEGAVPGDRVSFEKFPGESSKMAQYEPLILFLILFSGTPDAQLNPKKKIWEQIAPDLSTNDSLLATYKGDPFVVVGKGPVKAETLKNVVVK